MLVSRVCLQEQRKQSFLTLAKENQSPIGLLYRNPPTFFFTNPRFVLLIRDRHFVLLSLLRASVFITNHHRIRDAYGLRHLYDMYDLSISNIVNMDIFLIKMHRFATGVFYPRSHLRRIYYGCTRFIWRLLDCWTKTPTYPHSNAWKSKDNFYITPIGFVWKKKVIYT